MSDNRKHIVGFGMQNIPEPPDKDRETKPDYTKMALDSYLSDYEPYNRQLENNELETKTSREIQEAIKDMVTASISTITEYMAKNGYKMIQVEGGSLAWALQSNLPF